MKYLITTIVALVLVGCGKPSNPNADKALIDAVKKGNLATAKQAIADGADVNAKDYAGFSPLHHAATQQIAIAELLISKGADVNAKNDSGSTPLHWAVNHDFKELTELLIQKGANVSPKNKDGDTPLDWSTDKNTTDLLRKHGGKTAEELKAAGN